MNNPDDMPIDVREMRDWLNTHREETGLSWSKLAKVSGIPYGTISPFGAGKYLGNDENVARLVFRYKQLVDSQAERANGVPTDPGYFETRSSVRIEGLLVIAHGGRITVGATGPGTGKTLTARRYASQVANCFRVTMKPTSKTLNSMVTEVLRALGGMPKRAYTRDMSQQVVERLLNRNALLVIDEANHLEWESLEEIRAWHDATNAGICLLGNEELIQRIRTGPRRDAFARLNSRIAQAHVQNLPFREDVEAFCDAWGIADGQMRRLLTNVALTSGAGGLRECRQIVEQGAMLATDEGRALSFADLRDAQATRTTRHVIAA